jgi:hypothetical protein
MIRCLLVTAFATAILYGSTYQQFRFFPVDDPGGAADAIHYIDMARGRPIEDPEIRHFRWVTPAAARLITPLTDRIVRNEDLSIRLAFYLTNFAFSLAGAVALFRALQAMRYSMLLSLLGVSAFAASRVTVLVTATPMADAAYFSAIAILVCLTLEKKAIALAVMLPLLVLTKETIIPFLVLPFFTGMRRSRALWAGAAAAAVTFIVSGQMVRGYYSAGDVSLVAVILEHLAELGPNVARLLTPRGMHDLQHGFSVLLLLSVIGGWLNTRYRYRQVPAFVVATIPIALGLALVSGNTGRMFFAAFPAVIAYALITVEHVARGRGEPAPACSEG